MDGALDARAGSGAAIDLVRDSWAQPAARLARGPLAALRGLDAYARSAVALEGLAQDLGQQTFDVLTVGGLVKAEAQREERIVREQLGHLLADAAWISVPAQRPGQQTPEPAELDLGQSRDGSMPACPGEDRIRRRSRE